MRYEIAKKPQGGTWPDQISVDGERRFIVAAHEDRRAGSFQLYDGPAFVRRAVAALNLVEAIARLTKDGEPQDDGELYEQSIDDAYETLARLINEAREAVA